MKIYLKNNFEGTGEVRGFKFERIMYGSVANMYKVTPPDTKHHYEVFRAKFAAICIDFENRVYSETDFREVYPKSKDFGVWAWTFKDYEKALEKYNELIHVS